MRCIESLFGVAGMDLGRFGSPRRFVLGPREGGLSGL